VGYHGKNCDQCDKLLGCSRNGYCEKAFECKCREGWKGVDAQFVNPRPRIVFSSSFIDPWIQKNNTKFFPIVIKYSINLQFQDPAVENNKMTSRAPFL